MRRPGRTRRALIALGFLLVLVSLAMAVVATFEPTPAERLATARELLASGQLADAKKLLRSLSPDRAEDVDERRRLLTEIERRRAVDLLHRREEYALLKAKKARDAGDYAAAAQAIAEAGDADPTLRREIAEELARRAEKKTAGWEVDEAERLLELARQAVRSSGEVEAAEMAAKEARRQKEELEKTLDAARRAAEEGDWATAEKLYGKAGRMNGPADLVQEAREQFEKAAGRVEAIRTREEVLARVRKLLDKGQVGQARAQLDAYAKRTGDTTLSSYADALQELEKQGGEKSYLPVRRGLRWLAAHQGADGGFHNKSFHEICGQKGCVGGGHAQYDAGVTGLALMAFTAFSELDVLEEFRGPSEKAAKFLMGRVDKAGRIPQATGIATVYTQAIVALALLERSRVIADPKAEIAAATRIIRYLTEDAQLVDGGWRYTASMPDSDTSVTGWVLQAIHAAAASGIQIPEETVPRALACLDYLTDATGRTRYRLSGRNGTQTMTAATLLVKYLFADTSQAQLLARSAQFVAAKPPSTYLRKKGKRGGSEATDARSLYTGRPSFYLWYYQTYALRMRGGTHWKAFGPDLEKTLIATQETGGHALGSWDPVIGWSRSAGRIYATALATLTLEVYYRHKAGLAVAATKPKKKDLAKSR